MARDLHGARDLLLSAGLKVSLVEIREWSGWQYEEAEKWAKWVVGMKLSEINVGARLPKPGFLKKYSPPKEAA